MAANQTAAAPGDAGQSAGAVRHPELAARIQRALDIHPRAPNGRGQYAWLVREFKTRYDIEVTREGVRRWVIGEVEPRSERREQLAEILDVSVAWLMSGYDPTLTPKVSRSSQENPAADIVAGLLKLNGWVAAMPDSRRADIQANLRGRRYEFEVKSIPAERQAAFDVSVADVGDVVTLALIERDGFSFDLIEVRGEPGATVKVHKKADGYAATGGEVIRITDLKRPI
jgi:hypothetical protein